MISSLFLFLSYIFLNFYLILAHLPPFVSPTCFMCMGSCLQEIEPPSGVLHLTTNPRQSLNIRTFSNFLLIILSFLLSCLNPHFPKCCTILTCVREKGELEMNHSFQFPSLFSVKKKVS